MAAWLRFGSCVWTNHKISGTMSYGQAKQQRKYLAIMCTHVHKHSMSAQTTHYNWQAWWWKGDDWGLFFSHRNCITKYSRVRREASCPTAKAKKEVVHKWMPIKLKEFKLHFKEQWAKIITQWCKRQLNLYVTLQAIESWGVLYF